MTPGAVDNALVDADGDGNVDLLVGAAGAFDGFLGPFAGSYGLLGDACTHSADARWLDRSGAWTSAALGTGDVDGDAQTDWLIASLDADGAGVLDLVVGR